MGQRAAPGAAERRRRGEFRPPGEVPPARGASAAPHGTRAARSPGRLRGGGASGAPRDEGGLVPPAAGKDGAGRGGHGAPSPRPAAPAPAARRGPEEAQLRSAPPGSAPPPQPWKRSAGPASG